MKWSPDPASLNQERLPRYALLCGLTLARAHARSGDAVAISAYLGSGKTFDRAIREFAETYADQSEQDYAAFMAAIAEGRLGAHEDAAGAEGIAAAQQVAAPTAKPKRAAKKAPAAT
jgi:predicted alpha/beta hydrolase